MTTNRTRLALDGSIVASLARRAWSGSSVLAALRSSIALSIGSAFGSVLPATLVSRSVEHSVVMGFGRSAATAARSSFCYRWLTAEPEPEVIVIDLRETYSVGPVIRLVDAGTHCLAPAWPRSILRRIANGLEPFIEVATRSRIARTLAWVLAPPDERDR